MKHLIIAIPENKIEQAEVELLNYFQIKHNKLSGEYFNTEAVFRDRNDITKKYIVSAFWENGFKKKLKEIDLIGYGYLFGITEDLEKWLTDNNLERIPIE